MDPRRRGRFAITLLALAAACATSAPPRRAPPPKPAAPAVPNLRRVSEHVWSSGRPAGDAAFREIARLGVKTVICVDGEVPDVAAAHRAGLRYVHLPLNYAGIKEGRALELAKAARELEGPFLVHCHKGTLRGPAAAAIIRLTIDGGTPEEAVAEMRRAGAEESYKGLFASVLRFRPPRDTSAIACNFVEVARRPPLVETMTDLQNRVERLRKNRALEGDPAHEALIIREAFDEELRRAALHPDEPRYREAAFVARLHGADVAARAVEDAARAGRPLAPELGSLDHACAACHALYRDN